MDDAMDTPHREVNAQMITTCSSEASMLGKTDWALSSWAANSSELGAAFEKEEKAFVHSPQAFVPVPNQRTVPLSTTLRADMAKQRGDSGGLGFEGAADRFRKGLRAAEAMLGSNHPLTVQSCADLGACLVELGESGDWAEAEACLRRVLRFRQNQDLKLKKLPTADGKDDGGSDSADVALSQLYRHPPSPLGSDDDHGGGGARTQRLAVVWGGRTVQAALSLCDLLRKARRPAEAIPFARYAMASCQALHDDAPSKHHPELIRCMKSLAMALLAAAQMSSPRGNVYASEALGESEALFRACAAAEEERFGGDAEATRSSKSGVATVLLASTEHSVLHSVPAPTEASTTAGALAEGSSTAVALLTASAAPRKQEALRLASTISQAAPPRNTDGPNGTSSSSSVQGDSDNSQASDFSFFTATQTGRTVVIMAPVLGCVLLGRLSLDPSVWGHLSPPPPSPPSSSNHEGYNNTVYGHPPPPEPWASDLTGTVAAWLSVLLPNAALLSAALSTLTCFAVVGFACWGHLSGAASGCFRALASRVTGAKSKLLHSSSSSSLLSLESVHTLRILLLPPLFAVLSFLSLVLAQPPQQAETAETTENDATGGAPFVAVVAVLEGAREVLEALVLHEFLELMFCFTDVARDKPVPALLRGRPFKVPAPLSWLLHSGSAGGLKFDERTVATLERWTRQFVYVKPIEVLVRFYFCDYRGMAYWPLGFCCDAATAVSATFAMTALVGFYQTYKQELATHRPLSKFLAIKLAVFLPAYQKWALRIVFSAAATSDYAAASSYPWSWVFRQGSSLPSLSGGGGGGGGDNGTSVGFALPCLYPDRPCSPHAAQTQLGAWLVVLEAGLLFSFAFASAFKASELQHLESRREAKKKKELSECTAKEAKEEAGPTTKKVL
mmetsp:Transcript_56730/g.106512  ORF Transcript_56730/g.106512 Transcript_56730/m.106512 type:complete len:901 (+) Transcript_56730:49-2751(+)